MPMKLPQKILEEINELSFSLEPKKIKVSQKIIRTPKKRVITIPNRYLKKKQKELYKRLLSIQIPKYVFSQRGSFFADKARFHLNDSYLINIDIKNFYPSIHYKRIANLFRNLGVKGEMIDKITFMTTYQNCLPQGFVTSPILSNFSMFNADSNLFKYAKCRKIKYSRYVDDMTFSANQKIRQPFLSKAVKILKASGFIINKGKTEFFGPQDTKIVLGLKLGKTGVNITNQYLEKIVSHLEELKILIENKGDYQELKTRIRGELSFIKQIKPSILKKLSGEYPFLAATLKTHS